MTRVCVVCGNIYPLLANRTDLPVIGGAEVQAYLIGRGLAERGVDVSFVGEDFGQGREVTVSGLRMLAYQLNKNKLLQAWTLWQALGRADADIYYLRSLPKFGALIYLFVRVHRRKLVQALAGDVEVDPQIITDRVERVMFPLNAWWRKRTDAVLAQSQYQAQRLRQSWGVAAQVLPSLVPPAAAAGRKRPADFTVLWVAAISPRKGIERLADIAAAMPDINFIVAGGPVREGLPYYEKMKARLSGLPNVRWLGFVPYIQVGELFAQASVLLHTSYQSFEGFPNVFLQAWAMGVPCVTMGVDPDGLISRRGLGFCAEPEQAIAALRRLQAEPDLLRAMGERARAYVAEVHEPDVVMPQYMALLNRLAPRRAADQPVGA
jgi:glycosyltransferase involved in cell wall biosynthesis